MNDYVAKPIDPDQLFGVLGKWIVVSEYPEPEPPVGGDGADFEGPGQGPAVPSQELPPLAGIDVEEGLRHVGENRVLYRKLLVRFRDQQAATPSEIGAALASGERETARRLAHTLKGLAGTLGVTAVRETARAVEAAIKDGQCDGESLLAPLERTLDTARQALQALGDIEPETGPPQAASANLALLRGQFGKLRARLENFDAQALDTLREIRSQVPSVELPAAMQDLIRAVEEFDFETALQHLESVEDTLRSGSAGD
jgi:HPt (histidine-containing phosphotransfer) domain-containing protein